MISDPMPGRFYTNISRPEVVYYYAKAGAWFYWNVNFSTTHLQDASVMSRLMVQDNFVELVPATYVMGELMSDPEADVKKSNPISITVYSSTPPTTVLPGHLI